MMFEVHQLEGVDPIGRMFSRDVRIDVDEEGYSGAFSYEGVSVQSSLYATVEETLEDVAKKLQRKKFSAIRSRLNFREDRYYAEREAWTSYSTAQGGTRAA